MINIKVKKTTKSNYFFNKFPNTISTSFYWLFSRSELCLSLRGVGLKIETPLPGIHRLHCPGAKDRTAEHSRAINKRSRQNSRCNRNFFGKQKNRERIFSAPLSMARPETLNWKVFWRSNYVGDCLPLLLRFFLFLVLFFWLGVPTSG